MVIFVRPKVASLLSLTQVGVDSMFVRVFPNLSKIKPNISTCFFAADTRLYKYFSARR